MAVPKRRTSKTRKNKRRTHFKISVPGMTECPSCGEYKLSHRVCKTVVLTTVKKSFLNNKFIYLFLSSNLSKVTGFLFIINIDLQHCRGLL